MQNYIGQRGYGVWTVLLALLIAALIALELGMDILERMGGNVMHWTNSKRPRIGRAWEYQAVSASAMQHLEEIIAQREETRRVLQSPADFAKLPESLKGGKQQIISREKFLQLYETLPEIFARRLGTPQTLLEYRIVSSWNRTAFIGRNRGLEIYYINNENYVLQRIILDDEYFKWLERWGTRLEGNLEDNPEYAGRIYSASEFISAISQMPEADAQFNTWKELLKTSSMLVKVGVSRRWLQGMVEMAFQYSDGAIITYSVENEMVMKLLEPLPGRSMYYQR